jgi:hypothetical protein
MVVGLGSERKLLTNPVYQTPSSLFVFLYVRMGDVDIISRQTSNFASLLLVMNILPTAEKYLPCPIHLLISGSKHHMKPGGLTFLSP